MGQRNKVILYSVIGLAMYVGLEMVAMAAASGTGLGSVANTVRGNFPAIAKLITAGAYLAGFGFGVGAIVKFKAHKDNPTQIPISQPIALLFVAAALFAAPQVFKSSGQTLYASGAKGSLSGVSSLGSV